MPSNHVKKRVVTSCVECHRRKQKCDRLRPCNFCASRGVPELCRYDVKPKRSVQDSHPDQHEHVVLPRSDSSDSHAFTAYASPPSLLDQIGYSAASRRGDLERIGELSSVSTLNSLDAYQPTLVRNADAYLSFVARLPSEKVTSQLIDAHFSAENWSFPVLDEQHFRKLYQDFQGHLKSKPSLGNAMHLPATLTTFPALLFAVLAVTLQFLPPDTGQARPLDSFNTMQCDQNSDWYLEKGQNVIDLFRQQKPTTTSIEYHLVKMAWLKNCGRGDEAWQSLGVALRQAQEIDLHQIQETTTQDLNVDVGQTLRHLWEIEHQKRLWARIFIVDSHMAIALGRPRGIHREDCSTSAPLDCDYPHEPSKTIPVSTNHSHEPPSAFSPVMFSIALGNKYHELMSIRASKLDLTDYSRIQELHNSVQSLLTELPPSLRPSFPDTTWDRQKPELPAARLQLLTTANIFLLALHRPYVATHVTSRDAALKAGVTIMQAQQGLFTIVPRAQHKLFGYSFYTIDAGIFLAATTLKFPSYNTNTAALVLQELQNASLRLGCMKEKSTIARTGEVVIRRCCSIIRAHVTSAANSGGYDYIDYVPQSMDLTTSNFLQGFATHIPDQTTRELVSFLAEPSISMAPSMSAGPMVSEMSHLESSLSAFDAPIDTGLSPSNIMTQGMAHWPV